MEEKLMALLGKSIRLKRLIRPTTNSSVICALDHGMTSPNFLEGLSDTQARVREAIAGGANVLMLGRGIAERVASEFQPDTAIAYMLTASAARRPGGPLITPTGSVEEALTLGADAVVVYVALDSEHEPEMIRYLSHVGEQCARWGMPLIAEAEWPNAYQTLTEAAPKYGVDYLERNARLCVEMGADIVKVNWPGDAEGFRRVIDVLENVPCVVAGGTLVSDEELLVRMEQAVAAGAVGCSIGRNIFQHPNPEAITRALSHVIHAKGKAKEALHELMVSTA
jgi:class I fructose-bisphosphate aldolase